MIIIIDIFRAKKRANMEKFPEDVGIAESKTGGDPKIINKPEFQPEQKPDIARIFGDQTPKIKKGKGGRRKASPEEDSSAYSRANKTVIFFFNSLQNVFEISFVTIFFLFHLDF